MKQVWILGHCSDDRLTKVRSFNIYKKFPENSVGQQIEHCFLGRSIRNLPAGTKHLKR